MGQPPEPARSEYDRARSEASSSQLALGDVLTPAAGAEISAVVPANVWWDVIALQFTFATSAVVAARLPTVAFTVYGSQVRVTSATATQATSLTRNYSCVRGYPTNQLVSPVGMLALPLWIGPLPPGSTVATLTTAIDGGDQYSAVTLLVRQIVLEGLPQ